MYRFGDIMYCSFLAHKYSKFMDQVAGMGSKDVGSKQLSVWISQYFYNTFFCIHTECLAICTVE